MSTTLSPIPHTHHTMVKPKALHAFNSVVFVLALLATFSLVTTEEVQAMWLLLELACHYNYTHQRQVPMSESIHERALACFDILAVLAGHRGYRAKKINKNKITEKDIQEMLSAIIDPLLRDRTDEELTELEMTARSGGEVLIMPLDEIRRLVHMWTQALRGEAVSQDQLDRFSQKYEPGSLEWESETSRARLWESGDAEVNGNSDEERDVKLGIDPRTKPERIEAWSKTTMDETMSETMARYCPGYAAASTRSTLRRKDRTGKVAGRCRGFILFTTNEPMGCVEEPTIAATQNETEAMWVCEAPQNNMRSEDLYSPTWKQSPGEAGDWSQEADGVEWDMIPMHVEQADQGITYERAVTGWADEEDVVERTMEDVRGRRVIEWLQNNHIGLAGSASVSLFQSLGDMPNAGPNQDKLAPRNGPTRMELPVDAGNLFNTRALEWVVFSQHHDLRPTPLKRGRGGLDDKMDEYSSIINEPLRGNELELACPGRPAKRLRIGAVSTPEEIKAKHDIVLNPACCLTNRASMDLPASFNKTDVSYPPTRPTISARPLPRIATNNRKLLATPVNGTHRGYYSGLCSTTQDPTSEAIPMNDRRTWTGPHLGIQQTRPQLDTSTLEVEHSQVEFAPGSAAKQMQKAALVGPTVKCSSMGCVPSTPFSYEISTPQNSLRHVGGDNKSERVGEYTMTQSLRIVTCKSAPRDVCATNYAVEKPRTPTLASETAENDVAEASSDLAGKSGAEGDGPATYGISDCTRDKPMRAVRVLRVVNGSPSLTSSASSLPLTPRTEESGYSTSKATLAYWNEMTTYWEQNVQHKWQYEVAQWSEDDLLPEPSVKSKSSGVVRRMIAVLERSSN